MLRLTSFSLVLVAFLLLAGSATASSPSASFARKVVKPVSPRGAEITVRASATPGTRLVVSEFDPANQGRGAQEPRTGILALIAKDYAIFSYYGSGSYLFSAGGPIGTPSSWSIVDGAGNPLGGDDPRIDQFLTSTYALPDSVFGYEDKEDPADIAAAASYRAEARAGRRLYAAAKRLYICSLPHRKAQAAGVPATMAGACNRSAANLFADALVTAFSVRDTALLMEPIVSCAASWNQVKTVYRKITGRRSMPSSLSRGIYQAKKMNLWLRCGS